MMYLRNYKTDKQKRSHIERWWEKEDLFNLVQDYVEFEDENIRSSILACKTKKELLDKYLDSVWEYVIDVYSYGD